MFPGITAHLLSVGPVRGRPVRLSQSSYFYPLDLRVRQEWEAGRWPLWDPGHNGGEPLLGNPMCAVFYPGKVLYTLFPYAWAARLYVIAHTVIAFSGLLVLGRSFGVSWAGSCLGGLSYAFGAPVLFLYSNPIRLVGAAWVPWGLCAIDRLMRQGQRRAGAELAAVLALQVLGGDPEDAYLTAVCGAGYGVVLAIRARVRPNWVHRQADRVWNGGHLGWGHARPGIRPDGSAGVPGDERSRSRELVRPGSRARLALAPPSGRGTAGFAARQADRCLRLGDGPRGRADAACPGVQQSELACGRYHRDPSLPIHLHPCRVAEMIWPSVFGTNAPVNRSWLQAIPPVGGHEVWVESLYVGSLALVLALNAAGFRDGPPWRAWLTAVAVVGLVASLGKYGGPLWWVRWGPFASALGPHDPLLSQPRPDHFLPDGTGSPYGLLSILLPGFSSFRYPSKLLTFMAVGLAVLAALGWDRVTEGEAQTRRLRRLGLAGLLLSLVALVWALVARDRAVAYLSERIPPDPMFGPAAVAAAWAETQRALTHGAIVFAAVLVLAHWAPRSPRGAALLAILLLSADLAFANARLIWTAPQTAFDAPSEAARLIEAAERPDPVLRPVSRSPNARRLVSTPVRHDRQLPAVR